MSENEHETVAEDEGAISEDDSHTEEPVAVTMSNKRPGPMNAGRNIASKKVAIPRLAPSKLSPVPVPKSSRKDAVSASAVTSVPVPDLTTYIMIEVPADGKKGTEKAIYLVPKVAVKPNHKLVDTVAVLSGSREIEYVVESSPSRREISESDETITSLDYFNLHKTTLDLPPNWTLLTYPTFVAFMETQPSADLSQSLTTWFTKSVCLDANIQPSLKVHDVTVSSRFLHDLEVPFTDAILYDVLASLSGAVFCPGLGLEDRVLQAAVRGVVVPFQAADCLLLLDRGRNPGRQRCSACNTVRNSFLLKLSAA